MLPSNLLPNFPPGHPLNRLDCAHPNCRGKDNRPRVANRACDKFPQLCQTCCRAAGGCSKHKIEESQRSRLAKADKPASPSPIAVAPSAAGTSASPPAEPVSKFARPLKPGFGQGFAITCQKKLASNQKIEEDKKITETMSNLVVVLLWLKANSKPVRLNVVTRHAGTLVLSDQPTIMDKLDNVTLLSVFKALPRPEWIEQDLSIPIAIPRIPRILCRLPSLDNTDCVELDEELGVLGIQNRHFNTNTTRHGSGAVLPVRCSASASSLPELVDMAPHFMPASTGTSKRPRLSTPALPPAPSDFNSKLPFPRMYTCDMISGFRVLDALVTGGFTLGKAFSQAFERSDFVYKTVNKHRKVYERAISAHVLDLYRDMGRTHEGKWSNVVRDVTNILTESDEARQPSSAPFEHQASSEADADSIIDGFEPPLSPALKAPEKAPTASFDADYGGFLTESVVHLVTHQKFEMRGSQLTAAWTAEMENLNLYTTRTPAAQGSIKRVSIGYIPQQGMYAIKRISLSGEWRTQRTTAANATWVEASRVALCSEAACDFHLLANDTNTALYPFRVLPTSIFVICGHFQIAHEWIEGTSKQLSTEDLTLWKQTMDVFSHYTYQASGGLLLHSSFQYHSVEMPVEPSAKGKAVEGATIQQAIIFDCITHTSGQLGHDSPLSNIGPFLRSEGQPALANFANTHICNEVCRTLGLIPV
ncbi:hypothetical protein EYR36_003089 [Pleurotus pulmonarius]|nr:hypothetical protein EYR36_003089 [Pleurotus pulmonarius]